MTKKKIKKEKSPVQVEGSEKFSINDLSNRSLWIFTGVLALVYFVASKFSTGFYMHDEPELYITSRWLFTDPMREILSFRKIGYILFSSVPSLGGFTFLHFFNSLLSAVTVMYSYKLIRKLGGKNSILIFFVLGLQPLWFTLAFRNYTEFLTAFILVMTAWNHFNKRYIIAALLLSYAAFVRQENHLILGLYFLILVFNKQWIAAICTGSFTFLHNLVGYLITDDIFYLPNRVMKFSAAMEGSFPKRGFDHYFLMSDIVYGSIAIVLLFSYIGMVILKKKKPIWVLLVPVFTTFLVYCVFNHLSWNIGVGSGSLRYVLTIAPFMSILGILSLDEIMTFNKKYLLAIFLIPLVFLMGIYQTYDHDYMKLLVDGDRFWIPVVIAIIISVLLLLPLKQKHYNISIAIMSIFLIISTARTFNLNPEDATVKKASKWFKKNLNKTDANGTPSFFTKNTTVVCNHILFSFFTIDNHDEYNNIHVGVKKEITDTLKKGDVVIWDSHYGYRPKLFPGSQQYDSFDKNPAYQKIQYYQSKDNRFLITFFRKISD